MKIDFSNINNLRTPDAFNRNNKENDISFSKILEDNIEKVNQLQLESQNLNNQLVTGEIDNVHQVIAVSQKAELALQFTIQIRNKILDAYNEIMRMPI